VEFLGLKKNLDLLTNESSLILPSVRRLVTGGRCTEEEALLLCCGLVEVGFCMVLLSRNGDLELRTVCRPFFLLVV
jgi:hypothetical protein